MTVRTGLLVMSLAGCWHPRSTDVVVGEDVEANDSQLDTAPIDEPSDDVGLLDTARETGTPGPKNGCPEASAGLDLAGTVGSTVTLDASASVDPDGDELTFSWSMMGKPPSSAAVLSNPDLPVSELFLDAAGVYTFQLTVFDGGCTAAPDIVSVIARAP